MNRPPTLAALAALLVLLQALAPLAHRVALAAGAEWIEVCGTDGLRRLPVGDSPAAPSRSEDHCPLCRAGDAPAAPPLPAPVAAAPDAPRPVSSPAATSGRPTPHDASPRAPPAAV